MRIRVESADEHPFVVGCDVQQAGPFVLPLDAVAEREATVTLVGSLLDGGYDAE